MIYVTGDTHSEVTRFSSDNFPEQKEMTKDDYVIILGDFGLVWEETESKYEKYWLDWLEDKPFTTLFIDGNHENFNRLETYKSEAWKGGRIQRIRPSVIHLKRGYVFSLQGLRFFAFGGARSHDIDDGILNADDPRIKQWGPPGHRKLYRVLNKSWWTQEMPSEKERTRGIKNLEKKKFDVDFIITHDLPTSTYQLIAKLCGGFEPHPDELEDYLETIKRKTKYDKWFSGHYHYNINIDNKEEVLYGQIRRIV